MLSYQHGYHAGNFADVVKHLTLSRLLTYLTRKDKPLLYLETHSGKGMYDLQDKQALKTGEYKQGINLVWQAKTALPSTFDQYIQSIAQCNPQNTLRYYPGSPAIALNLLRSQDRAYLCELHTTEFKSLSELSSAGKKVHISNSDGMISLNALLPPPEKRGLIFIDPSYEVKEEYKTIPAQIKQAHAKFASGVYCLWYPIVHRRLTEQLLRNMAMISPKNALRVEFNLTSMSQEGMTGCGLWIINPPYTLIDELKECLNLLKNYFSTGASSFLIEPC